jgi:hypothetical protein
VKVYLGMLRLLPEKKHFSPEGGACHSCRQAFGINRRVLLYLKTSQWLRAETGYWYCSRVCFMREMNAERN